MIRNIKYNLWKMKRSLAPRGIFAKALQKKLDSAWENRYGAIPWYRAHLVRLASAGIIGVFVAGSFGTGAYAYVSPEVTEDSVLYPVKQKLEAVEERVLNRTPEAKARFYLKQIARREAETVVLVKRGRAPEQMEERVEKVEEKLVAVRGQFAKVALRHQAELEAKIQARLTVRRERLERQAARLASQLQTVEAVGDDEKLASASTSILTTTTRKQVARRAERQKKITARLKLVQERIGKISSFVSSSQSDVLKSARRTEKISERLKRRINQLENQLDRRKEKLEGRKKIQVTPTPPRRAILETRR